MRRGTLTIFALCLIGMAAENPDELYRQGMRLLAERKPDEALAAFRRVTELSPKYAAAWAAIGVVHASRGDYPDAEEPFHRACLLNPSLPDACLYFGRTLYLEDRFEEALDVLRAASTRDPANGQIHRIEALCLEALDRGAEAEQSFQQALKLERGSPANEDPAIDYGVFLYRRGRAEEALKPLQAALDRHPDSARAHLEMGCVLLALDRAADAASHLQRAGALDSAVPRAHLLLGRAYLRLGKPELAQRELDQGWRTVK
jgi:Flp pilus assembly protein TadD